MSEEVIVIWGLTTPKIQFLPFIQEPLGLRSIAKIALKSELVGLLIVAKTYVPDVLVVVDSDDVAVIPLAVKDL